MSWAITVHKVIGDPAHVEVSGGLALDANRKDDIEWLYGMLKVIGDYDEHSEE